MKREKERDQYIYLVSPKVVPQTIVACNSTKMVFSTIVHNAYALGNCLFHILHTDFQSLWKFQPTIFCHIKRKREGKGGRLEAGEFTLRGGIILRICRIVSASLTANTVFSLCK